jgi:hypothetical protein
MTTGIKEMHKRIEQGSDKGKPTLRRILATHEAVQDGSGMRGGELAT